MNSWLLRLGPVARDDLLRFDQGHLTGTYLLVKLIFNFVFRVRRVRKLRPQVARVIRVATETPTLRLFDEGRPSPSGRLWERDTHSGTGVA